ncbi:lipolytic enzyme, partial [Neohortaea acidophila]
HGSHWVTTWSSAQQGCPARANIPQAFYSDDGVAFENATIRQTVRLTLGGDDLRIRLSNAFVGVEVQIDRVTIALPALEEVVGKMTRSGSPTIEPASLQQLSFAGRPSTIIPAGGQMISDPVAFPIPNDSTITISLYISRGQETDTVTCHMVARTRTWIVEGDSVAAPTVPQTRMADTPISWYFLSAVEAWKPLDHHAVVVFGDSITDVSAAPIDSDLRWTNRLFRRLQQSPNAGLQKLSVLNQAVRGNRLIDDDIRAPNLNARLDSDAIAISGIKFAVIVEGLLDITRGRTSLRTIVQFQQMIARLHAADVFVFGATLKPFSCVSAERPWRGANRPPSEVERLKVNRWIRNTTDFDAMVDFDETLRNPSNTTESRPEYQGEDCLHPSLAGMDAMADVFPLDAFERLLDG